MPGEPVRTVGIAVDSDFLSVTLSDGRILAVPLAWYPRLLRSSAAERERWEIGPHGQEIRWPDLDEVLELEHLLAGVRSKEAVRPPVLEAFRSLESKRRMEGALDRIQRQIERERSGLEEQRLRLGAGATERILRVVAEALGPDPRNPVVVLHLLSEPESYLQGRIPVEAAAESEEGAEAVIALIRSLRSEVYR